MRILLINPPVQNEILGNNPQIVQEERGYNPPLGLLYLATVLNKQKKHEVKLLDTQVEELNYSSIEKFISEYSPDIAGLTVMTFTLLDVIKTCSLIKKIKPSCKIILGGPHVHLFPKASLNTCYGDFAITGEGEYSFPRLIDNINDLQKCAEIPGVCFFSDGKFISGPGPGLIDNLDDLPHPDRTLLPYKKYGSILASKSPVTTMFTSRGCPYKCRFCDRPHLGKNFRAHSAEYVIDEMQQCEELGIKEILVYDDTFTIDRKRTLDICKLYKERRLSISWDIRARVNTIDEEIIKALKHANCQRIHFGVEAGTEKILKVLNKGINKKQALEAFRLAKKYGIETLAYFMIGSPSETEEDIKETFRFARFLSPDYLHLTILTPFPGTEIYQDGIKQGLFSDFWRDFAEKPVPEFKPKFWDAEISESILRELIIEGYKKFYFRPSYIFRRIMRLKSTDELKKKFKAAFKLFLWKD